MNDEELNALIEEMGIEEIETLLDNEKGSHSVISDSVVNIYMGKRKPRVSEPTDDDDQDESLCINQMYQTGEYCEDYCVDCDIAGALYEQDVKIKENPLLEDVAENPLQYLWSSVKTIFSRGETEKEEVIEQHTDTSTPNHEILEDEMSMEEIEKQLDAWNKADDGEDDGELVSMRAMMGNPENASHMIQSFLNNQGRIA